ncbi:MAG TPA: trehalose-6-phosphate synthase [Candidatus Binataceae bacterium]
MDATDAFESATQSAASLRPVFPEDGRLVVISNRAPIQIVKEGARDRIKPTVGGVGTTFLRVLARRGGSWIAWSGGKSSLDRVPMPPAEPRFSLEFIQLSQRDISNYYYGMCNRGLWPLMHFMTPNCHFSRLNWDSYQRVNEIFAAKAAEIACPGDTVWIQDFHLALVPQRLRARRRDLPIGIFWHVPFAPEQLYRILPWRNELLEGLLGADLIGFHTHSYVTHFLNCCERILGLRVDRERGRVHKDSRTIGVGAFPLGIPTDFFSELATNPHVQERAARIRRSLRTPIVVLGVDRLDYTKGILERLLAFERFLETYPSYRRRVTLVLIAVPSRTRVSEYAALKRQLDELVGRVVGKFSSEGWVPIRYLYTQFEPAELASYYQASDIALLAPLRDGMNLVAKEYVASRPREDGVLILSEFAGAAEELTEALLVNPYDIDAIAARLKQAVEMSPEEKARRHRAMLEKITRNNLDSWSAKFLNALAMERNLAEQSSSVSAG